MKMARDARGEQSSVSKRLSALERKVGALTKEAPPRPEDQIARQAMAGERPDFLRVTRGNADYETPVHERMAALKGRSRNDTVSDRERGSASPLGRRKR